MCASLSVSAGCISPGSLSFLGRGAGAPQSGIHNLWAVGPCQSAAATQHVSTPQGAVSSPTCVRVFLVPPSFYVLQQSRYSMCLISKQVFRTRVRATLQIFPLLCPELLAMLLVKDQIPIRKEKYSHTHHCLSCVKLTSVFHNKAFNSHSLHYAFYCTACFVLS